MNYICVFSLVRNSPEMKLFIFVTLSKITKTNRIKLKSEHETPSCYVLYRWNYLINTLSVFKGFTKVQHRKICSLGEPGGGSCVTSVKI